MQPRSLLSACAISAATHWLTVAVRGRQLHEWKRSVPAGFVQERHRCDGRLHFRLRLLVHSGNCFRERFRHGDGKRRCFERGGAFRGWLD